MWNALRLFLRAEIVLGFLIATAFWTTVLGWQAAYAPTEIEKQQCYEAAQKAGQQGDECKSLWERTTSDPVALFTLVLAVSTVGLWVATIALYFAGERELEAFKASSERQSADMNRSIVVAELSAKAAEDAATATKQSVATAADTAKRHLRAYVGFDAGSISLDRKTKLYSINGTFKNYGLTPAYACQARISRFHSSNTGPPPFRRSGDTDWAYVSRSVVGPGAVVTLRDVWPMPDDLLGRIERGEWAIFIFGEAIYKDAFEERHRFIVRSYVSGPARQIRGIDGSTGVGWPIISHAIGHEAD